VIDAFIVPSILANQPAIPVWLDNLTIALGVVVGVANIAFLFSSLAYIKWVAPLIASPTAYRYSSRAFKYLLWSIPCGLVTAIIFGIAALGLDLLALFAIPPGLAFLGLILAATLYNVALFFIVWVRLNAMKRELDEASLNPTA